MAFMAAGEPTNVCTLNNTRMNLKSMLCVAPGTSIVRYEEASEVWDVVDCGTETSWGVLVASVTVHL
jgi:hypothetical protein